MFNDVVLNKVKERLGIKPTASIYELVDTLAKEYLQLVYKLDKTKESVTTEKQGEEDERSDKGSGSGSGSTKRRGRPRKNRA